MCKVSVIVPIYNAEPYLRQCLDSLLAQTMKDFELILVDDGSPDHCGAICDEYARQDNRIKVIHQPNGGVSRARQAGLDAATGEYIIHTDPDDWVESTMLEELYNHAQKEQADMVMCDFWEDRAEGSCYSLQNPGVDCSHVAVINQILGGKLHGSLCNKLVRREICKDIRFEPEDITIYEDELFIARILVKKTKITYLPKGYYHYNRKNNTSLCCSLSSGRIDVSLKVLQELQRIYPIGVSFFAYKSRVLWEAIRFHQYKYINLFPEIHDEIIQAGVIYNWKSPIRSCLSIALRGWPRLANILFLLNMSFLSHAKKIRSIFRRA